jgi:type 1 glutamine amidotransferase
MEQQVTLRDFRGLVMEDERYFVRGRVFCFTPGHTAEVLNNPVYRGFLERGPRWALRVENT